MGLFIQNHVDIKNIERYMDSEYRLRGLFFQNAARAFGTLFPNR